MRRAPSSVEDRLRDLSAPSEGAARRRAWALAAAEHAARPKRTRRTVPALALATALALLAALSPPGNAVADWVEDRVRSVVDEPAPSRAAGVDDLPGGGRILLLAGDPATPWVAGRGDHRRLLGAVGEATWSPRGLYVAATRGPEVIAVDLKGRRRWSIAAPATARAPSWSPSGFRVAYVAGTQLRVVAGDGTGDRLLAGARSPRDAGPPVALAPAWRPGRAHVLAFARAREVVVLDADTGAVAWRRRHQGDLLDLAYSPRGDRLLVAGRSELQVLHATDGARLERRRAPRGSAFLSATWSRDGRRLAIRRRTSRRSEILLTQGTRPSEVLFTARGLGAPAFSPDGRWLMLDWRDRDSWVFLPLPEGRPRLVTGIQSRFGGSASPVGWCCPP